MATQNNKKMLHKKEPQMLGISLVNSSAGSFIIKDPLGVRRTALLVSSATVQRLYDINEDGWQELPSFALAGTFGAGACGAWSLWSDTITANGGTTTSLSVSLSVPLSHFIVGKTIEFTSGSNIGRRVTVSDADVSFGTDNVIFFNETLPNPVQNTDTFKVNSGRYFILNAGAMTSGSFKSYDVLTGIVTTKSQIGLPTWGTDGKLIATPSYVGEFASGTTTTATINTLSNSNKNWTENNFINYQIRIIAGTGIGQTRTIISNTSNTITVSNWDVTPDNTSQYVIESNDDFLYLIGNNAVTMYRYQISTNSWSTILPNVARSVAPGVGMSGNWVGKTNNSHWQDENKLLDGRYIYSFVGGATSTLHRYDIALNKWELITYLRQSETFAIGSSYDVYCDKLFIKKNTTNRFFYYDIPGNQLIPFIYDYYPDGTAVVGDKMFTAIYNDGNGDNITFLYYLLNTSNVFRRVMIY